MIKPFTLSGQVVRLEPLRPEHAHDLAAAASEDRASYAYTRVPDGRQEAEQYVTAALQDQTAGRTLPWVVRRLADERVVGTTRYLDLDVFVLPPLRPAGGGHGPEPTDDCPPSVLEIGSTWYAASVQRTAVNTEVKLLQLTHAFDFWGVLRVTFKTDARNQVSRKAIERLGAKPEGVRRAHIMASDGTARTTRSPLESDRRSNADSRLGCFVLHPSISHRPANVPRDPVPHTRSANSIGLVRSNSAESLRRTPSRPSVRTLRAHVETVAGRRAGGHGGRGRCWWLLRVAGGQAAGSFGVL